MSNLQDRMLLVTDQQLENLKAAFTKINLELESITPQKDSNSA